MRVFPYAMIAMLLVMGISSNSLDHFGEKLGSAGVSSVHSAGASDSIYCQTTSSAEISCSGDIEMDSHSVVCSPYIGYSSSQIECPIEWVATDEFIIHIPGTFIWIYDEEGVLVYSNEIDPEVPTRSIVGGRLIPPPAQEVSLSLSVGGESITSSSNSLGYFSFDASGLEVSSNGISFSLVDESNSVLIDQGFIYNSHLTYLGDVDYQVDISSIYTTVLQIESEFLSNGPRYKSEINCGAVDDSNQSAIVETFVYQNGCSFKTTNINSPYFTGLEPISPGVDVGIIGYEFRGLQAVRIVDADIPAQVIARGGYGSHYQLISWFDQSLGQVKDFGYWQLGNTVVPNGSTITIAELAESTLLSVDGQILSQLQDGDSSKPVSIETHFSEFNLPRGVYTIGNADPLNADDTGNSHHLNKPEGSLFCIELEYDNYALGPVMVHHDGNLILRDSGLAWINLLVDESDGGESDADYSFRPYLPHQERSGHLLDEYQVDNGWTFKQEKEWTFHRIETETGAGFSADTRVTYSHDSIGEISIIYLLNFLEDDNGNPTVEFYSMPERISSTGSENHKFKMQTGWIIDPAVPHDESGAGRTQWHNDFFEFRSMDGQSNPFLFPTDSDEFGPQSGAINSITFGNGLDFEEFNELGYENQPSLPTIPIQILSPTIECERDWRRVSSGGGEDGDAIQSEAILYIVDDYGTDRQAGYIDVATTANNFRKITLFFVSQQSTFMDYSGESTYDFSESNQGLEFRTANLVALGSETDGVALLIHDGFHEEFLDFGVDTKFNQAWKWVLEYETTQQESYFLECN